MILGPQVQIFCAMRKPHQAEVVKSCRKAKFRASVRRNLGFLFPPRESERSNLHLGTASPSFSWKPMAISAD